MIVNISIVTKQNKRFFPIFNQKNWKLLLGKCFHILLKLMQFYHPVYKWVLSNTEGIETNTQFEGNFHISFFSVVQMDLVLHFCYYFCSTVDDLCRTMVFYQAWHRQKVERIHYTFSLHYLVMFGRCCYLPIITRLD